MRDEVKRVADNALKFQHAADVTLLAECVLLPLAAIADISGLFLTAPLALLAPPVSAVTGAVGIRRASLAYREVGQDRKDDSQPVRYLRSDFRRATRNFLCKQVVSFGLMATFVKFACDAVNEIGHADWANPPMPFLPVPAPIGLLAPVVGAVLALWSRKDTANMNSCESAIGQALERPQQRLQPPAT